MSRQKGKHEGNVLKLFVGPEADGVQSYECAAFFLGEKAVV